MEYREYRYVDKSEWQPGEWMEEPDKIQFEDKETGLPCLIVRGPSGALCGYVGVAEGHPAYQQDYSRCDLDVHGGLTFSDFCVEDEKERGICHIPGEGESDKVWWLGFDCAHYFDITPKYDDRLFDEGEYRNLDYVKGEISRLAMQVHLMPEDTTNDN